jgi:8-oxo-dGTP pyrophosphatase MutT (NUDIX family)
VVLDPASRHDRAMSDELSATAFVDLPRTPASAGALIFDDAGSLLILKTSYKKRWSIPGGQIEAGESPWEACRRETLEECGLVVERGALVCVDFLRPRPNRPGGLRFVFNCGRFAPKLLAEITLQPDEIEQHRFAAPAEAVAVLTRPVGRRVAAALGVAGCIYLEDGEAAEGVTNSG